MGIGFGKALPNEEARVAFDELMDMCRSNGIADGAACNQIILVYGDVYSVGSTEDVAELEYKLNDVLW